MGIYHIKPKFQQLLKPFGNFLIRKKVHPTTINILAFILSVLMGLSFLLAKWSSIFFLLLPIGAFARTAFNALDGMVARSLGLASAIGEVYNEFFDRASDAVIFICLGISNLASAEYSLVAISFVLINSYLGIVGKAAGGSRVYIGAIGKADRMILIGTTGLIAYFYSAMWIWDAMLFIIIAGTAYSSFQRLQVIKAELE